MNAGTGRKETWVGAKLRHSGRAMLAIAVLCGVLALLPLHACAQEPTAAPDSHEGRHTPMGGQGNMTAAQSSGGIVSMDMGSMESGSAPARDPNAYSDGYECTGMPGMEKADQISVGKVLIDQLEFTHSSKGDGVAWDTYAWYDRDENKLHLRSEGGVINGAADDSTSAEALWWRALAPFRATLLGVRQDFGPGSHTHLAFGVEGLAPYWFNVQATFYVADDGGFSARFKASYDLLITNRLILSPEVESNLYSKANQRRGLGTGVANIEPQLRLRYEFTRKFAPYVGFDWDRALGSTANRRRAADDPVSDARFVADIRLWW